MTKWQTRQALYLLGLTGILYLFSCKSQDIRWKMHGKFCIMVENQNVFTKKYKGENYVH